MQYKTGTKFEPVRRNDVVDYIDLCSDDSSPAGSDHSNDFDEDGTGNDNYVLAANVVAAKENHAGQSFESNQVRETVDNGAENITGNDNGNQYPFCVCQN